MRHWVVKAGEVLHLRNRIYCQHLERKGATGITYCSN